MCRTGSNKIAEIVYSDSESGDREPSQDKRFGFHPVVVLMAEMRDKVQQVQH